MYISSLSLANFRNYTSEKIEFSPYTNVIYGDNAQGKTNILEAVYIFSQGRSHRAKSDKELIKFGEDFSRLSLDFHDSERDYTAAMQLMKNGRKNIKINHVQITKLSKLMNYLNVVMFSPEDLELVKGSPSARRKFIDSSVSQLYTRYLTSLIDYHKALGQKNSLGEKLQISYMPGMRASGDDKNSIYEYLEKNQRREIDLASAQVGVQRDDLHITINGSEAKIYGSQGQQRTSALSMKIAQADYIHHIKSEYPILLLDDIMSELDINRRMYLSQKIRDKQVLITSTDTDLIESTDNTKLFKIKNGSVVREEN